MVKELQREYYKLVESLNLSRAKLDCYTVVFVIQLANWNGRRNGKAVTEAEANKQTEWIVENIMEGYDDLIKNPCIQGDGDFMLYFSLGTLLKQMEKDGATLRIMLLKPNYTNQVMGDIPLSLTPAELKPLIIPKK